MRSSVPESCGKLKGKIGIITEFYSDNKTSGTYIMVNIVLNGIKVNAPTRMPICL